MTQTQASQMTLKEVCVNHGIPPYDQTEESYHEACLRQPEEMPSTTRQETTRSRRHRSLERDDPPSPMSHNHLYTCYRLTKELAAAQDCLW